ncbi:MAG TPA: hypothetical protein DEP53_15370 [Bacteroidetes bacterium]|nr:hypothetical protein [Bacteroidota bacterium]
MAFSEPQGNLNSLELPMKSVQRLVDQFNHDEMIWRSLEPRRPVRRKMLRRSGQELHQALDLLEFDALRPVDDCVGTRLAGQGREL